MAPRAEQDWQSTTEEIEKIVDQVAEQTALPLWAVVGSILLVCFVVFGIVFYIHRRFLKQRRVRDVKSNEDEGMRSVQLLTPTYGSKTQTGFLDLGENVEMGEADKLSAKIWVD